MFANFPKKSFKQRLWRLLRGLSRQREQRGGGAVYPRSFMLWACEWNVLFYLQEGGDISNTTNFIDSNCSVMPKN